MIQTNILIIGGGLTGLTLQYLLEQANYSVTLLEARHRLGGRILTHRQENKPPIEMGATWLGKKHTSLNRFLKLLDIGIFPQILGEKAIYEPISTSPFQLVTLPKNEQPSYRIQGGTSTIIETLSQRIQSDNIYLGQKVHSISETPNTLIVESEGYTFEAQLVISTVPPNLLQQTISISPSLPPQITNLLAHTHTWMAESIKFGFTFKAPFWRTVNSSGTVSSNVGPIPELYDHSNFEDNLFALKGFLNGSYFSLSKTDRLMVIIKQLNKYYGDAINNYTDYQELIWAKESLTYAPYIDHMLPHQNNGHPAYQQAYLDGKFYIAGSETTAHFPGYMEGAVNSAYFVYEQIKTYFRASS